MTSFYVLFRKYPEYNAIFPKFTLASQTLIMGSCIGILSGLFETVFIRDNLRNHSGIITFIIRILSAIGIYMISMIFMVFLTFDFDFDQVFQDIYNHEETFLFLFFIIFATFFMNIIRSVDKKYGHLSLLNSLLGKFQTPQENLLIIVFIDLKGATSLAERLGFRKYSDFLREYFFFISNICIENKGSVYQFAGDGVFLTWSLNSCRKEPHFINFFYDIDSCFKRLRKRFIRTYGEFPTFKGAAHCGRVIKTEVGNYGSEIALHGDTINTTARIQGMCNLLKQDFLISEVLKYKLPINERYRFENCGTFQLKGKTHETDIFAIKKNRTS